MLGVKRILGVMAAALAMRPVGQRPLIPEPPRSRSFDIPLPFSGGRSERREGRTRAHIATSNWAANNVGKPFRDPVGHPLPPGYFWKQDIGAEDQRMEPVNFSKTVFQEKPRPWRIYHAPVRGYR
jgi:hypothetical protein